MLIGEIIEKIPVNETWQMAANKVADTIRNIYLTNTSAGYTEWEESFFEAQTQVEKLREEGFKNVYEIEYIFKWWGNDEATDGLAGEIDVIWKLQQENRVDFYKTTCRVATRDFVVGTAGTESKKRAMFQQEFQRAFEIWRSLLQAL